MDQIAFDLHALPVFYECSFRYFEAQEKHIDRICSHYVLIFMLRRALFFQEDGQSVTVSENEWYIQLPHLRQSGIIGCPFPEYFYIHFSVALSQPHSASDTEPYVTIPIRGVFSKEHMIALFTQLEQRYRKFPWDILGQQAIFLHILSQISAKKSGNRIKRSRFVYDILDDLHQNYNQPLSLQDLACKYNYAKDYIARRFKQETGHTPFEYVQSIRLQTAKERLSNTDYSIESISRQVGYSDVSLLYKAFRATTGISPGLWRKKSRLNEP
jgi:AraC-like DNA-binding protein